MTFQIHALPVDVISGLKDLTEAELEARSIRRVTAIARPGFPCRVSLQDAAIGETLYLLNYTHQPADTPYRAAHAIFVREAARQAFPAAGEIADVLKARPLSLRGYDKHHMMIQTELAEGEDVARKLDAMFADTEVEYIHQHNSSPGCYAARATRSV
ncbi:DUF1203 domain-containing protein [Hyphobacterium sp.]|uniref:DUF1203 domain-containing protein n=1 Tax=Hyphobacterium sp. TaxID=2004662 RepID=UPI003B52F806